MSAQNVGAVVVKDSRPPDRHPHRARHAARDGRARAHERRTRSSVDDRGSDHGRRPTWTSTRPRRSCSTTASGTSRSSTARRSSVSSASGASSAGGASRPPDATLSSAQAETTPLTSAVAAVTALMPRASSCAQSFAFPRISLRPDVASRVRAESVRHTARGSSSRRSSRARRGTSARASSTAPAGRRLRGCGRHLLRVRGLPDSRIAAAARVEDGRDVLPVGARQRRPPGARRRRGSLRTRRPSPTSSVRSGASVNASPDRAQELLESPRRLTGRGFARAPGRCDDARPRATRVVLRDPEVAEALEAAERARAPRPAAGRRRRPSASRERASASGTTGSLKRSAGARHSAFIAPCGDAVAPAERLRHRMREEEPALGRAPSPRASRLRAAASARRRRGRPPRRRAATRAISVAPTVASSQRPGVERLGAVRERVQRRADRLVDAEGRASERARRRSRRCSRPSHRSSRAAPRRACRSTASTRRRRTSSGPRRAAARSRRTPPSRCRSRCRRRRATRTVRLRRRLPSRPRRRPPGRGADAA